MEEKKKGKYLEGEHAFLWITLIVAIVFFAAAIHLYVHHPGVGGDAAFPVVASFIMLLGAVVSVLEARGWENAHEGKLSLTEKLVKGYRMIFPQKTLIIALYCLIYAIILNWFGFNISTFIFLYASMLTLHPKQPVKLALISLGTVACIYIIFVMVFRVRLP